MNLGVVAKTDSIIDTISEKIGWAHTKGTRFLSLSTLDMLHKYEDIWVRVIGLKESLSYDARETLQEKVQEGNWEDILAFWNNQEIFYSAVNNLTYTFQPQDGPVRMHIFPVAPQDIDITPTRFESMPRVVLLDPALDIALDNMHVYAYDTTTQEYEDVPVQDYKEKRTYAVHTYVHPDTQEKFVVFLPYYDISFFVPQEKNYTQYTLEVSYKDRATEDPSGYTIDFKGN